jgi:hypothetical protein
MAIYLHVGRLINSQLVLATNQFELGPTRAAEPWAVRPRLRVLEPWVARTAEPWAVRPRFRVLEPWVAGIGGLRSDE